MIKICAISDIHGQFDNLSIEPVDILFICGDIVPLYMQRNIPQSLSWFKKEFYECFSNYFVIGNFCWTFNTIYYKSYQKD